MGDALSASKSCLLLAVLLHGRILGGGQAAKKKKTNPEPTLILFHLVSATQRIGHSLKTGRKVLKK